MGVTYFAGTFVRHPLALAAAKAALEHLKQDGNELQTQLNLHTAAMADELKAFCREVGAPLEIRYFSSLWRVSWLEDHPLQDLLFAMMRSRGVHILDNFPCFMTTAHSQQDIATIKSAFKESIAEMQEAELLPRRAAPKHGARSGASARARCAPGARQGRPARLVRARPEGPRQVHQVPSMTDAAVATLSAEDTAEDFDPFAVGPDRAHRPDDRGAARSLARRSPEPGSLAGLQRVDARCACKGALDTRRAGRWRSTGWWRATNRCAPPSRRTARSC